MKFAQKCQKMLRAIASSTQSDLALDFFGRAEVIEQIAGIRPHYYGVRAVNGEHVLELMDMSEGSAVSFSVSYRIGSHEFHRTVNSLAYLPTTLGRVISTSREMIAS